MKTTYVYLMACLSLVFFQSQIQAAFSNFYDNFNDDSISSSYYSVTTTSSGSNTESNGVYTATVGISDSSHRALLVTQSRSDFNFTTDNVFLSAQISEFSGSSGSNANEMFIAVGGRTDDNYSRYYPTQFDNGLIFAVRKNSSETYLKVYQAKGGVQTTLKSIEINPIQPGEKMDMHIFIDSGHYTVQSVHDGSIVVQGAHGLATSDFSSTLCRLAFGAWNNGIVSSGSVAKFNKIIINNPSAIPPYSATSSNDFRTVFDDFADGFLNGYYGYFTAFSGELTESNGVLLADAGSTGSSQRAIVTTINDNIDFLNRKLYISADISSFGGTPGSSGTCVGYLGVGNHSDDEVKSYYPFCFNNAIFLQINKTSSSVTLLLKQTKNGSTSNIGSSQTITIPADEDLSIIMVFDGTTAMAYAIHNNGAVMISGTHSLNENDFSAVPFKRLFWGAFNSGTVSDATSMTLDTIAVAAVGGQDIEPLKTKFHVNFNTSYNAVEADGVASVQNTSNRPDRVTALDGLGADYDLGEYTLYRCAGNLDKSKGSIEALVKWPVDGLGTEGSHHYIFCEHAIEDAIEDASNNATKLWIYGGMAFRFDTRSGTYSYIEVKSPFNSWKAGEYHHIVVTWDNTKGAAIWADGKYVGGIGAFQQFLATGDDDIPYSFIQTYPDYSWATTDYTNFAIGSKATDEAYHCAWGSIIDDFKIYNRVLSEIEIRDRFYKYNSFNTTMYAKDAYVYSNTAGNVRFVIHNDSNVLMKWSSPSYEIKNSSGTTVQSGTLSNTEILAKGHTTVTIPVGATNLSSPGTYTVTVTSGGTTVSTKITVIAATETVSSNENLTLITTINAVNAYNNYLSDTTNTSEIVMSTGCTPSIENSLGGQYLEAGSDCFDRFALKFSIDSADVGKPYMAVIYYPDDKPRSMEILYNDLLVDSIYSYQAVTGVFTGDEYLKTYEMQNVDGEYIKRNTMQTCKIMFWPESTRGSFIFMTEEDNYPAAVQEIKLYKFDNGVLGKKQYNNVYSGTSYNPRNIGLYYEDPILAKCFASSDVFSDSGNDFEIAVDRLLNYMGRTGLDTFSYPVVWYHGPVYGNSECEPDSINPKRPHPSQFPRYLMKRMYARDTSYKFIGTVQLHSLASLETLLIPEDQVINGTETVGNMMSDNSLKVDGWHGTDPYYNPLDPTVQQAIINLMREIGEYYGDLPAFKGVMFVMARLKMMHFGSLQSGYNDINIINFQEDKDITLTTWDAEDEDRFSNAYNEIMNDAAKKSAWINWRCEKIHQLYRDCANALRASNSSLKLYINLMPQGFDNRIGNWAVETNVFSNCVKETGIDPALFAMDSDIVISRTMEDGMLRNKGKRNLRDEERFWDWRTMYMAPEASAGLATGTFANIHDRYWESNIGNTNPISNLAESTDAREHPWRASQLHPGGRNALEIYMRCLDTLDALFITKGGFVVGTTGIEDAISEFAAAYRTLPAVAFDDVNGMVDPVRIRQKVADGNCYIYVLNKQPVPVCARVNLSTACDVTDLVNDTDMESVNSFLVPLKAYELRTFRADSGSNVVTGGVSDVLCDPEAYYTFDDNDYADEANDYTGTPQGSGNATFETSKHGYEKALHLDGSKYVQLPSDSSLNMGTGDYTVCFYFRLDDLNDNYHFIRAGCTGDGFLIRVIGGRLFVRFDDTGSNVHATGYFGTQLSSDTWYHVAVTFDRSGVIEAYLDGIKMSGSINISAAQDQSVDFVTPIRIGWDNVSLNGSIDEIKIYKRLLSSALVIQSMEKLPLFFWNKLEEKLNVANTAYNSLSTEDKVEYTDYINWGYSNTCGYSRLHFLLQEVWFDQLVGVDQ